jgi:hypothetical protein
MFRKSEVAAMAAGSRYDDQAENVHPEREVRRVKGGYKFRWLIREETELKPPPAIRRTAR